MKNSSVRFALALMTLVVGAALEEMLPKAFGVGFPVLLAVLPVIALHAPAALPVLFALAAGAMEDALSSLPVMTSPSFFLLAVVIIRWVRRPLLVALLAFPCYELWLCLWMEGLQGSVFGRVALAFPFGALTVLAVAVILRWLDGKAGVDEAD